MEIFSVNLLLFVPQLLPLSSLTDILVLSTRPLMYTLIVHPEDETTDMLCQVYASISPKTVVRKFTDSEELIELVRMADQVIMCGHGSSSGLLCGGSEDSCYIIDETFVPALREKSNSIFLWCNAADFMMEHDLCGMFSGMFISEVGESMMFGIEASKAAVDESNQIFAEILRRAVMSQNSITTMHSDIITAYSALAHAGNPIAAYNCARWFVRPTLDTEVIVHRNTLRAHSVHPHVLCWSGGCRDGAVCNYCYSAKEELQPSYYHCISCSWDICEACLSQHTDRCVLQRPDTTPSSQMGSTVEEGAQYIADSTPTSTASDVATVGGDITTASVPLCYAAGHMFMTLPQGEFLVDTGCPFSFGSTHHLTYGPAYDCPIPPAVGGITMESLRGIPQVFARAVGVLGMDAMLTSDVMWDGPSGRCSFDAPIHPKAERISYQLLASCIVIDVDIMGVSRRCLFDTGAQFGYVLDEGLVSAEGVRADPIRDYNPIMGSIESESWLATVRLGDGVEVTERFGVLTGLYAVMLQSLGVDAVLGVSWMANKKIWFVPSQSALYIID
jgi:hypothetical protein